MKMFLRSALLAAALAFGASPALAQSSPGLVYGQVPTAGQWNSYFAAKQDVLGYTPVNKAGDTMSGRLITIASGVTAGFNVTQGSAPSTPVNGDVWITSSGMFARAGGVTYGPFVGSGGSTFAGTSPITVSFPAGVVTYAFNYAVAGTFTAAQAVNLNTASLPSPISGAALNVGAADATVARVQVNAFGAIASFTGVVYGGTNAAKTQVLSGTQLTGINAYAYTGSAVVGPIVSFRTYAAENITATAWGSKACIATTPSTTAVITDGLCQHNSGGVVIGSPTGSDKGVGTLNATGLYVNGTAVTAAGITALTGDVTATGPGSVAATLATSQPGAHTWAAAQTFSAAMTYGGVTLSNAVTGTGAMVLGTSPSLATPAIGVATGTSLALGGCTISTNAFCATGTAAISSTLTSAAHTITSASATALVVGLNGATNPGLLVDASTALSATGLKIKSAAAAGGLALSVVTSGTNENLTIDAAGSGTITLAGTSTGAITLTRATTLSAALTYGGVTLSNAVTGTGNMVLATGPSVSSLVVTTAFTATGLVANASLATMATNTVKGNATSGTASPTDLAVGTCSTAASALIWTTNTGFGCNTSITAAAVPASGLTGTTMASSVVTSSLTTVGALVAGSATTGFTINAANVTWSGQIPGANVATVANASGSPSATFGVVKCDGTTITCASGTMTAVGGAATDVTVGTTTVSGGTGSYLLYNNAGVLGNRTIASVLTAGDGILITGTTNAGIAVDKATAANYYAAASNKVVTADIIYPSEVTITYGATTTVDFDTLINGVVTLTGNITTLTLSNVRAGKSGTIRFVQDGTGSRTWPAGGNTVFKYAGGTLPALTTTASAVDVLNYTCQTTSFCEASLAKNVKNP